LRDIPADPTGDRIQELAGEARRAASPRSFSEGQRRAIADQYAVDRPWVAQQLERKYLGTQVHNNLNELVAADPEIRHLQVSPRGVDYTDAGSQHGWELLSDTDHNLRLHALRPTLRDEFVRYIKYRMK
jgi:hypothetical protein